MTSKSNKLRCVLDQIMFMRLTCRIGIVSVMHPGVGWPIVLEIHIKPELLERTKLQRVQDMVNIPRYEHLHFRWCTVLVNVILELFMPPLSTTM